MSSFHNRPPQIIKPSEHPRRVRGGVKLKIDPDDLQSRWAAQRWLRLFEPLADDEARTEGPMYARTGQTRRLDSAPGIIDSTVQGRMPKAYRVAIKLSFHTHEQWDQVIEAMADQAMYAAKLLSGELPPNVEDVFAPLGLWLFPRSRDELDIRCTCGHMASEGNEGPICKHVYCVAHLVAERLASDPFFMLAIRGLPREDLVERLRQRRAAAGTPKGGASVVNTSIPGSEEAPAEPLENAVDQFWDAGPAIDQIDLPLEPPEVKHPLLRRLGPSPFDSSPFPLLGLLATCYEMFSERSIRQVEEDDEPLLDEESSGDL